MSKYIDKFFSFLPFILLGYHFFAGFSSKIHFKTIFHLGYTYILSGILKAFFRGQRRIKSYAFQEWPVPRGLARFKNQYGFPSSHTMFYIKYILLFPSILTIFIMCIGAYSRVVYQHHTYKEVLWGILIVILLEILIKIAFGI